MGLIKFLKGLFSSGSVTSKKVDCVDSVCGDKKEKVNELGVDKVKEWCNAEEFSFVLDLLLSEKGDDNDNGKGNDNVDKHNEKGDEKDKDKQKDKDIIVSDGGFDVVDVSDVSVPEVKVSEVKGSDSNTRYVRAYMHPRDMSKREFVNRGCRTGKCGVSKPCKESGNELKDELKDELKKSSVNESASVFYYDLSSLSADSVFRLKLIFNNLLSVLFSYHKPLLEFYFSKDSGFGSGSLGIVIERESSGYVLRDYGKIESESVISFGLLDTDSAVSCLFDYLRGKGFVYCKFVVYPNNDSKYNYMEFCESDILGLLRDNVLSYSVMAKGVSNGNHKIANRMGDVYKVSMQKRVDFLTMDFPVHNRSKYEGFFKRKPYHYKLTRVEVLISELF